MTSEDTAREARGLISATYRSMKQNAGVSRKLSPWWLENLGAACRLLAIFEPTEPIPTEERDEEDTAWSEGWRRGYDDGLRDAQLPDPPPVGSGEAAEDIPLRPLPAEPVPPVEGAEAIAQDARNAFVVAFATSGDQYVRGVILDEATGLLADAIERLITERESTLIKALEGADDHIYCECILNVNLPDDICEGHQIVRDALRTVGVHIPPLEEAT